MKDSSMALKLLFLLQQINSFSIFFRWVNCLSGKNNRKIIRKEKRTHNAIMVARTVTLNPFFDIICSPFHIFFPLPELWSLREEQFLQPTTWKWGFKIAPKWARERTKMIKKLGAPRRCEGTSGPNDRDKRFSCNLFLESMKGKLLNFVA